MTISRAMQLCGVFVVGMAIGLHGQTPATRPAAPAKQSASKPAPPKAVKLAMPPAVEAAFKTAYPTATIKGVSKEKEDGQVRYEVESVEQGLGRDVTYLADGTLVELEEEMSAADFPAAVAAAIKTRYPAAKITKREKVTITKDNVVQYEAALSGAKVREAILTEDGTWVSPKGQVGGSMRVSTLVLAAFSLASRSVNPRRIESPIHTRWAATAPGTTSCPTRPSIACSSAARTA